MGSSGTIGRLGGADPRVHLEPVVSEPGSVFRWPFRSARWCGQSCVRGGRVLARAFVDFYNSSNLTFAASIAYYSLLSLFPFLLLVLAIVSRIAVTSTSGGQNLLHIVMRSLPSHFDFLTAQVQDLANAPLRLSLAGTLVTLWASMGVFGAITSAVNHAWGVEQNYSFLKHKLIAFVMMLVAGVLAVTALVFVSLAQIVETRWFSGVLVRFPELVNLSGLAYQNASTVLFIFIAGLIYYYIPNAQVRLRDVWFGAIFSGVLWRVTFAGFAWYVRDLSRFTVHGSIAAVVVFLVWIYLSSVILLYGVEITAAMARLRRDLPTGVPAAPVRE
jgi:membrane protein